MTINTTRTSRIRLSGEPVSLRAATAVTEVFNFTRISRLLWPERTMFIIPFNCLSINIWVKLTKEFKEKR